MVHEHNFSYPHLHFLFVLFVMLFNLIYPVRTTHYATQLLLDWYDFPTCLEADANMREIRSTVPCTHKFFTLHETTNETQLRWKRTMNNLFE